MKPRHPKDPVADSRPAALPVLLAGLAVTATLIAAKNPLVFLLLATDGALALAVLVAAGLGGLALLPLFRIGHLPLRQQVLQHRCQEGILSVS